MRVCCRLFEVFDQLELMLKCVLFMFVVCDFWQWKVSVFYKCDWQSICTESTFWAQVCGWAVMKVGLVLEDIKVSNPICWLTSTHITARAFCDLPWCVWAHTRLWGLLLLYWNTKLTFPEPMVITVMQALICTGADLAGCDHHFLPFRTAAMA